MISRVSPVNFKSTFVKTPLLEQVFRTHTRICNDNDVFWPRQLIGAFDVIQNDGKDDVLEIRKTEEKKLFGTKERATLFVNGEKVYSTHTTTPEEVIFAYSGDITRKGFDGEKYSVVEGEERYSKACTEKANALSEYTKGLVSRLNEIKETFI